MGSEAAPPLALWFLSLTLRLLPACKVLHRPVETTPFFGGTHAAIASSLSQIVTSPRLLRPRSYSLQFRILYFFLYWRLTRLDFAATTTLPPRSL